MSVVTEALGLPDDADAATIKTAIAALQTLAAYAKLNEPPVIHVHVPEQQPPVVNVTVPETQATPVQVDVHVPKQAVPVVNVTTPSTPVNPKRVSVTRGRGGLIDSLTINEENPNG